MLRAAVLCPSPKEAVRIRTFFMSGLETSSRPRVTILFRSGEKLLTISEQPVNNFNHSRNDSPPRRPYRPTPRPCRAFPANGPCAYLPCEGLLHSLRPRVPPAIALAFAPGHCVGRGWPAIETP